MVRKSLLMVVIFAMTVMLFNVTAWGIEKGESYFIEDSTGTNLFTLGAGDNDVDSSTVIDVSSMSSFFVQFKCKGVSDTDSNSITVAYQVSSSATPTINDFTQIDSSVVTQGDTTWHAKELDLSGAKTLRIVVHASAANLIAGTGALAYIRRAWTRAFISK